MGGVEVRLLRVGNQVAIWKNGVQELPISLDDALKLSNAVRDVVRSRGVVVVSIKVPVEATNKEIS
jgi:hypothetical protein